MARSNHCLSAPHVAIEGEPASASSLARLIRMENWLQARSRSVEQLQALFTSRDDGVDSINRYPEDEQGTATNSVVLFEPHGRRLLACRGPADRGAWQHLHFAS